MKTIKPNWVVKFGWITGKPERPYNEYEGRYGDRIQSLCGIFWRFIRTAVIFGILAVMVMRLLAVLFDVMINHTKDFFIALGTILGIVASALVIIFIGSLIGDKIEQTLKQRRIKLAFGEEIIEDGIWAVKNKVCPVYKIEE